VEQLIELAALGLVDSPGILLAIPGSILNYCSSNPLDITLYPSNLSRGDVFRFCARFDLG